MNIILVGYGKMGKEIEKILLSRGHTISNKITRTNPLVPELLMNVDVAIEFSTPDVVLQHLTLLIKNQIPTIVGTTGWNDKLEKVTQQIKTNNGALVYASNFSIGVNLFFQLNRFLAKLMKPYTDYSPKVTEIHHTEKLDAPSGTAITLAEDLCAENSNFTDWYCPQNLHSSPLKNAIEIEAKRITDVKGNHQITYQSNIDTITIGHQAHSREGFALGAVIAAEWLLGKKGIFTMKDVLQLS